MGILDISTAFTHAIAVRLCALVYFFAFLGNVIDGPVMWLLSPPSGGWTATSLVRLNQFALIPSLVAFVRPWWWPALAICWPAWHATAKHGGLWFHFGWDSMMDEIGFLALMLAITLTFYEDIVEQKDDPVKSETSEAERPDSEVHPMMDRGNVSPGTLRARKQASYGSKGASLLGDDPDAGLTMGATTLYWKGGKLFGLSGDAMWRLVWGLKPKQTEAMEPCGRVVDLTRTFAELSFTLAGFRLFIAAGLMKMRVGSRCWKNHTCLYDHFETQPMPNAVAWYFHNYTTESMKRFMQWFAIDVAECILPYLLLSFLLSSGPMGLLHAELRRREYGLLGRMARFPGRLVGGALIILFVMGMFVSGNYSFLHPLSIVSLVASMGTLRGTAVAEKARRDSSLMHKAKTHYRLIAPWFVIICLVFAFLPSLRAYAWIFYGDEYAGGEAVHGLMTSGVARQAEEMNLGIPYNHHAYFAGAVHQRNEMVLFANVGDQWIELDIPYKVGRVNRSPRQTSPLHRRFAWEWWFLALGTDPTWLEVFLQKLCERDQVAWGAVEWSPVHSRVQDVQSVKVQMYNYHFSKVGEADWWTRAQVSNAWGSNTFEQTCN